MATNNFPIFLAEIEVVEMQSFQFYLPKKDIGRSDVLIHIEYSQSAKRIVQYQVWGQLKDTYIRAFLLSSSFSVSTGSCDVISKIMFDLNSSDLFYEQVHSFLDHFSKAR